MLNTRMQWKSREVPVWKGNKKGALRAPFFGSDNITFRQPVLLLPEEQLF